MDNTALPPFDQLTLEQAKTLIGDAATEASAWRFYAGQHWQDSEGWVGPLIDAADPAAAEIRKEIERSFITCNLCREVVDRHVDAVLNREPRWGSVLERVLGQDEEPTDAENAAIAALDELMTAWWDSSARCTYTDAAGNLQTCNVHELMQRAARRFVTTGRAYLRLFIPPGLRTDVGLLPALPLEEAVARVFVELCESEAASMAIDRRRMQQVGVYFWRDGDKDVAELTYLDDLGNTVLRQVMDGSEGVAPAPALLLDGNLLHCAAIGDALLTPSIIAQQKDLNRTLTMGGRAMNLAGFPERVLLDVQLDGTYEDDPDNPGKKRFIPKQPNVGAGTMNMFAGLEYTDAEGKVQHAAPSYQRLDPPGTAVFDSAAAAAARRIRDEARQSHVEMSADATASGRSREQARWEFVQSLAPTVAAMNRIGRWLLTTTLLLGVATSNSTRNPYEGLKFDFACRIDPGPLDAGQRAEDRAQVEAGLLSRESAMARAGVDDVDAEASRIAGEEEGSLAVAEQRARIAQTLAGAGAGIEGAALVAGFDQEQAAELARGDFVDAAPPATVVTAGA